MTLVIVAVLRGYQYLDRLTQHLGSIVAKQDFRLAIDEDYTAIGSRDDRRLGGRL